MPWQEVSTMSLRKEFVMLANVEGANRAELCRRFGISRKTGYKWLARAGTGERAELADRSRRPQHSPTRTPTQMEEAIVALRDAQPVWGARKLRRRLQDLGQVDLPAPSTVQAILQRHQRINVQESAKHQAWQRFEHAQPNDFWQMDFKGHFALGSMRCHPLTVLDDHSRFNICLQACSNEQRATVQAHLSAAFRRYGLPWRIGVDNGPPWGDCGNNSYTALGVWLLRLGIQVSHSRPYHPQTLGKDERFHRTLKYELIEHTAFRDLRHAQTRFDQWREVYNHQRPHEALDMHVPATRYRMSERAFPAQLPSIEYGPGDIVRKVHQGGWFFYQGKQFKIGKAFVGNPIALRPTTTDGLLEVYFCQHNIAQIDLTVV
jgi:transposase InsO family protein